MAWGAQIQKNTANFVLWHVNHLMFFERVQGWFLTYSI